MIESGAAGATAPAIRAPKKTGDTCVVISVGRREQVSVTFRRFPLPFMRSTKLRGREDD
jgi:hypothetical protein